MRTRSRIPVLEPLEGKALLSSVAAAPVGPVAVASANEGVVVQLTTNQLVYHEGQAVQMTLTETNMTNHDVTISVGPSIDGFYVTKKGKEVWASNTGPQPQYILLKTLAPGQSFTLTATWNGQSNIGSASTPTGTLVVHSQVAGANTVTIVMRK